MFFFFSFFIYCIIWWYEVVMKTRTKPPYRGRIESTVRLSQHSAKPPLSMVSPSSTGVADRPPQKASGQPLLAFKKHRRRGRDTFQGETFKCNAWWDTWCSKWNYITFFGVSLDNELVLFVVFSQRLAFLSCFAALNYNYWYEYSVIISIQRVKCWMFICSFFLALHGGLFSTWLLHAVYTGAHDLTVHLYDYNQVASIHFKISPSLSYAP